MLCVASDCIAEMINVIAFASQKQITAPGLVFTKACPGPLLPLILD